MPFHHRKSSGELDVFEAARYFSGANETNPRLENAASFSRAFENRPRPDKNKPVNISRLSLDMPMNNIALDTKRSNNKKPHKQPSSPGGKLIATLVNSIFNHSPSKKKKNKSSKDSENRKTRISTSSDRGSRVIDSYAKTGAKSSSRDFPVSRPGNSVSRPEDFLVSRHGNTVFRPGNREIPGNSNFGLPGRNKDVKAAIWDDDDGVESDSSSDLFDLPMIRKEINFFSKGLPVYGTTHMERIRRVVV